MTDINQTNVKKEINKMPTTRRAINQLEVRSEEVQEIITHMPSWIILWGTSMILVVFLILLSVAWFVKYPDILSAKVKIQSDPAPIEILTRSSGQIVLLKQDGDEIESGEPVAYIRSDVNYYNVLELERQLGNISKSSFSIERLLDFSYQERKVLGTLSPYETNFRRDVEAWLSFHAHESHKKHIAQLYKQKASLNELAQNQADQLSIFKNELILAKNKFITDSLLHLQNVTSNFEFSEKKTEYLREIRSFANAKAANLNNELQIEQLQTQIVQLELEHRNEEIRLKAAMKGSYNDLVSQISGWKLQNIMYAPLAGKLAYLSLFQNGMTVAAGDALFTALPISDRLFAYAQLPLLGSGKVKVGQEVNIRLDGYPFEEFGMLTGEVYELSSIPNQQGYILKIRLPDGLNSTHHKKIPFKHNLTGVTEVITEDLRLLERIFFGLRRVFSRS